MDSMTEVGIYLIQALSSLYLLIVLLRFLLQLCKANFYNPVSQFIVKATQPPLGPIRKIIPPVNNIDFASLLAALAIQLAAMELTLLVAGGGLIPLTTALVWALIGIASMLLNIFFYGLFAAIIVSWILPQSHHPAIALIWQLMEPVMTPFRKMLPNMGGIDLSPIFMFLLINVLRIVISNFAASTQLPPGLVLGI
ncbi:YggT family protein [Gammaproteobacteria bacterium 50_400_T64]|nr:YggT family protein [Gammaproteobacteria bacterium 50_400_T64]